MFVDMLVRQAVAKAIRKAGEWGEHTYLCHVVPGFADKLWPQLREVDSNTMGGICFVVAPDFPWTAQALNEVRARFVMEGPVCMSAPAFTKEEVDFWKRQLVHIIKGVAHVE